MKSFLLAVLLSVMPISVFADWTKIPSGDFSMKGYPSEGSAAFERDFDILKQYQESRSNEQCALARRQEHPTYSMMFMSDDSPLSSQEAERAEPLVTRVMKLAEKVANFHKGKFRRLRPYDTDPSIEPCTRKPGGEKSYPSSHAATSAAGACVLAQIFPGNRKAITAYGDSLGELRVVVGVHHPSDVEAGQQLGREVCDRLLGEDDFLQELKALKF